MSHDSTALYHAIPQAPVAAAPVILPEPELDGIREPDEQSLSSTHSPPALDSNIVWIMFILGCAVLLPWNVMITATPYFLSRVEGSPYRNAFSSYMMSSFTASNFICLSIATYTSKQASQSRRVLVSTLILAFLTLLLTLTTFVHLPAGLFFTVILLNGIMQANAGGYLQTSLVVIGALFGPAAMQALMSGQAAVAVIVSGVQVISSALSVWGKASTSVVTDGEAEESAAFIFFALSTLFLLFSVGTHLYLVSLPAYQTVVGSIERRKHLSDAGDAEERRGLVSSTERDNSSSRTQIIRVTKANIMAEIAVWYTFVSTLAVFPAITVNILPTNPNMHPLLFSALHFLVFNVGDLVGRAACSYPRFLIWSQAKLLIISVVRTLFIPLFLMCNVQRPSTSTTAPVISSDFTFMIIVLACGLSCGYVSTMCMITTSSLEHNPKLKGRREDVDVAASVASFFLVGGLAVGSIASFAVTNYINS